MYSVTVKDHFMIAHSLPDPFFGEAQNTHGATYVVHATFMAEELNEKNVVLDIGEAASLLNGTTGSLNYKNLDDLPEFNNVLTTTEFLAKYIHEQIKPRIDSHIRLKILLEESHVASAAYEG